VNSKIALNRD